MKEFKVNNTKPDVKVIENCVPNIYFTKQALSKMKVYIDECDKEIGWLGTAYQEEDDIIISDMMLFDQEVSSVTTDIDDEALSKFGEQLLKEEDGVEKWNNIRVWGHSHVKMGVTPSTTDDEQMEEFEDIGHDWFIRIIGNKSGELRVDLFRYDIGIAYHKMPWNILRSKKEMEIIELIQLLEEELEEIDVELEKDIVVDVKKDIKKMVRDKSYGVKKIDTNKVTTINSYSKKNTTEEKEEDGDSYYDIYKYGLYSDYTDYDFDIIHEENINAGLFELWTIESVLECDTLEEVRDALHFYGFEGMYFYTDKDINDIIAQMEYILFEEEEDSWENESTKDNKNKEVN